MRCCLAPPPLEKSCSLFGGGSRRRTTLPAVSSSIMRRGAAVVILGGTAAGRLWAYGHRCSSGRVEPSSTGYHEGDNGTPVYFRGTDGHGARCSRGRTRLWVSNGARQGAESSGVQLSVRTGYQ